jgi:hypothetical protein
MSTRRRGKRGTRIAQRIGMPVVLTTTTADVKIFPDDSTRFLTTSVDDSAAQTRAIVTAQAKAPMVADTKDLLIWRVATSLLKYHPGDFENPQNGWSTVQSIFHLQMSGRDGTGNDS